MTTTDYEARLAELRDEYEDAEIASEEECDATEKLLALATELSRELSSEKARREGLEQACAPFLKAWDSHKYGHGVSLRDWQLLGKALRSTRPVGSLWTTPVAAGVAPEPGLAVATPTVPEIAEGAKETTCRK
jgi:hypothetical protein